MSKGKPTRSNKRTARRSRITRSNESRLHRARHSVPRPLPNAVEPARQLQAQLDIVNTVSQGLASKLNFQGIIDLVGDKLREVVDAQGIAINLFDQQTNTFNCSYLVAQGKRLPNPGPAPVSASPMRAHIMRTRQPLVVNTNEEYKRSLAEFGSRSLTGSADTQKSMIGMPIMVGDQVTGVIYIGNYEREHAYSESDVRLLSTLASSMGIALENARLFNELQSRNREITEALEQQTATSEILRVIASSPTDAQPVMDAIAASATRLCNAVFSLVLRYDGEFAHLAAHHNFAPDALAEMLRAYPRRPSPEAGITIRAILERQVIHIADTDQDPTVPEFSRNIARMQGYLATLSVPMLREGKVIGAIGVAKRKAGPFTNKQITLLKTFADQAGIAIENVRLFNETRQRAAELEIINSVQQGLASKLDITAIYNLVGDELYKVFQCECVQMTVYDHLKNLVYSPYCNERGDVHIHEPAEPIGFTGFAIKTGQVLWLEDISEKTRHEYGARVPPGRQPITSFVSVPLMSSGELRALVSLQNIDPQRKFSESDVRLLTTLASSMSVALENARLFDETQRLLKETEQRAAELQIINSVQAALASKLDMQAIYDLVGDKIREIFDAQGVSIRSYDAALNLQHYRYVIEKGQRFYADAAAIGGWSAYLIRNPLPLWLNQNAPAQWLEISGEQAKALPGTDLPKSFLAVPLVVGNQTRGGIALENIDRENAFSESDVRLLQTLANSMSVALESARLFDETNRLLKETNQRAAELAIINSVQEGLASKLDFQGIIDLIGDKIRDIFDAQAVLIASFDLEKKMADMRYNVEKGKRVDLHTFSFNSALEYMVRTRQPILFATRVDFETYGLKTIPGTEPSQSGLVVPLVMGNIVWGAISLQNLDRENAFSQSDLRLVQTLANSMSVALENARLFDETQRLLKETEQRAAELALINSVQQGLASQLDFQAIIDLVGNKIRDVFEADVVGIRLYDRDKNLIYYPYTVDHGERYFPEPRPPAGMTAHLMQTRQPEIFHTYEDYERVRKELGGSNIGGPTEDNSFVFVPIVSGEQFTGAISIGKQREHAFSDSDVNLLSTLASSLSVALENARLFDAERQRAAELAIINDVGQALATQLNAQTVIDMVGDKILQVFDAQGISIRLYDPKANLVHYPYMAERGKRLPSPKSRPPAGFTGRIIETRQPLVVNRDIERRRAELGGSVVAGEGAKSLLGVPIIVADQVIGVISLENLEREDAFSDSDVRVLMTIAANMGVVMENARLYAETLSQKTYFEAVVQASPVAIALVDLNTHVAAWNPAAEKLFGYTRAEALGKHLDDLVANRPDLREDASRYTMENRDTELFHAITRRTRKDGSLVDVELHGVRVRVGGQVAGGIAIYHDITELEHARQQAIAANEAKSAFLATMSHEIRTPMNAVIGMSNLLLGTNLNAEQREFAEIVRNSGDALLTIINDILDFSKIEAGKMDLESLSFDLRDCVESALDLVTTNAAEKGLDLAYLIDENVPAAIVGDATRLRQVLLNLLSNAVKFTETGEVVLSVTTDDGRLTTAATSVLRPSSAVLHFSVRDTGIGIPSDRIDRLFQSFSQVDASTSRKYGGTGLGLAISKRLAEMMGGSMWAESEGADRGSTFHFVIRALPAPSFVRETRAVPLGEQAQLLGKRILIVDDNATNRRILMRQTQLWGMIAQETQSPREAITWIERGDSFDVAILDMQMPELDGVKLAGEIRRIETLHTKSLRIPLILASSLGHREIAADGIMFAAYLTKPLKLSSLFDTLVSVFVKEEPSAPPVPSKPQIDPTMATRLPLRILLAEDNAVNQKLALRILSQMGYRADVAGNGIEAIQAVERQAYDVILMDVQMPEMDGLEATRQIRRSKRNGQPRIIAMTANATQGDREMCLASGMDDYIAKPIRVDEFVSALNRAK